MRQRDWHGRGIPARGELKRWLQQPFAHLIATPRTSDERYFHQDLKELTFGELRLQRTQLELGLLLARGQTEWWPLERLQAIEACLETRLGRQ